MGNDERDEHGGPLKSLHLLLSLQYYLPRPMSLLPMSQTSHVRQCSSKAREDTGHESCSIQKQWGLTETAKRAVLLIFENKVVVPSA